MINKKDEWDYLFTCYASRSESSRILYILYSYTGSEVNLRFFVAVDKRFEYTCTKGKPYSGTPRESMEKEDQEIPEGETLLLRWR